MTGLERHMLVRKDFTALRQKIFQQMLLLIDLAVKLLEIVAVIF